MKEKLKSSAIGRAVKDFYGQAIVGRIFGTASRALVDVLGIWFLLLSVYYLTRWIFPAASCERACFEAVELSCCNSSPMFFIQATLFLLAIALGSFIGTRLKTVDKFQHSGLVSALLLASVVYALLAKGASWGSTAIVASAVFLSLYAGYRLSFRLFKR